MKKLQEAAQYLLRFDDICPTMNWAIWNQIEAELERYSIKPLLAVIPDNIDPELIIDPPCEIFWSKVREWQSRGYTIAIHGYQHKYVNQSSGIMRLSNNSEFAGLSEAEQEYKITRALKIFHKNGVRADAWIAPSHSFDKITVKHLKKHGVDVISDGLWRFPFTGKNGVTWVPQQLWELKRMPGGVWTVCYHHNNWGSAKLLSFSDNLRIYSGQITDLPAILNTYKNRRQTIADRFEAEIYWQWHFGGLLKTLRIRTLGAKIKLIWKMDSKK